MLLYFVCMKSCPSGITSNKHHDIYRKKSSIHCIIGISGAQGFAGRYVVDKTILQINFGLDFGSPLDETTKIISVAKR